MYYCFVEEDLIDLREYDQLIIQAKYAKRLGLYCCCRLWNGTILDQEGQPICLINKCVLLRATCNTMLHASNLLQSHGAKLFEKIDDICAIEHWERLNLARRRIFPIRTKDIFDFSFSPALRSFLLTNPRVFVKSRKKGFCVQLPSQKLLKGDSEIFAFFKEHYTHIFEELLISEALSVKSDSLGLKESRHFVFDGVIRNSSRTIHSVKHFVPPKLFEKAVLIVESISIQNEFPQNYVLDVGEFEKAGESFFDIIELNPITSSLCYVNNSVFDNVHSEALSFHMKTGMGAEYCYDAINYPERYTLRRYARACYSYINTEHYSFY